MNNFDSLSDSKNLNKMILKRFKTVLLRLDIKKDFFEISTEIDGVQIQVRVFGKPNSFGKYVWHVVRVVNQSIIPIEPLSVVG